MFFGEGTRIYIQLIPVLSKNKWKIVWRWIESIARDDIQPLVALKMWLQSVTRKVCAGSQWEVKKMKMFYKLVLW